MPMKRALRQAKKEFIWNFLAKFFLFVVKPTEKQQLWDYSQKHFQNLFLTGVFWK